MTPIMFIAIAGAGGLGAVLRLVLDGMMRARRGGTFTWGTVVINISGSFVLGLVTGLALTATMTPNAVLVVGTGFLGGYTTFSTASFETVRLLQARKWLRAITNGFGVVLVATLAAAAGLLGATFI